MLPVQVSPMVPNYAGGHVSELTARIGIVADVGHRACRQVLAKVCPVMIKIEIDLCVLAVYNRIIVLHTSVSGAILKISSGAGG